MYYPFQLMESEILAFISIMFKTFIVVGVFAIIVIVALALLSERFDND